MQQAHYVLQSLAWNGRGDDALAAIREIWHDNIQANEYTIWELRAGRQGDNDNHSLCHAFSCAPLYFLQSVVLGIRPLKPGFRAFSLTPQPCGLRSAKGRIPTPHGPISVEWSASPDGNIAVKAEIPEGTHAVIGNGQILDAGFHEFILQEKSCGRYTASCIPS